MNDRLKQLVTAYQTLCQGFTEDEIAFVIERSLLRLMQQRMNDVEKAELLAVSFSRPTRFSELVGAYHPYVREQYRNVKTEFLQSERMG